MIIDKENVTNPKCSAPKTLNKYGAVNNGISILKACNIDKEAKFSINCFLSFICPYKSYFYIKPSFLSLLDK